MTISVEFCCTLLRQLQKNFQGIFFKINLRLARWQWVPSAHLWWYWGQHSNRHHWNFPKSSAYGIPLYGTGLKLKLNNFYLCLGEWLSRTVRPISIVLDPSLTMIESFGIIFCTCRPKLTTTVCVFLSTISLCVYVLNEQGYQTYCKYWRLSYAHHTCWN